MSKLFNELVTKMLEKPREVRWDRISDTIQYLGWAEVGTAEDVRGWTIWYMDDSPQGGICYANNDSDDSKIWTVHATAYSYSLKP